MCMFRHQHITEYLNIASGSFLVSPMQELTPIFSPLLQPLQPQRDSNIPKFVLKTPLDLRPTSPKKTEKNAAKREKEVLMCGLRGLPSPKDGVVETDSDIIPEHRFHA